MLTYKYRIYPTREQEHILNEILWIACWLYNKALEHREKYWRESRRSISCYDQGALWRDWRNEDPEENPLRILNMDAGQKVLRKLDDAYRAFFKGMRGRPRFKTSRRYDSVAYKYGNGSKIRGNRLYIQNVGLIKVRWHRDLPDGRIKQVIVKRKPSGWYACFQIELPEPEPEPHQGPAVGVDVGIHHALALSDGMVVDSLRSLEASLRKLRVLQRSVARKKRGSNRRQKAVKQVARQHEQIANQRRDFWHKVTRWLVDRYGLIAVENLPLAFMTRNEKLAKAAHDVGLGIFREVLDYKAMEAGAQIVEVNPKFTSQMCSGCGEIVEKDLSVRVHRCEECGLEIDRDVNAARNILALALEE